MPLSREVLEILIDPQINQTSAFLAQRIEMPTRKHPQRGPTSDGLYIAGTRLSSLVQYNGQESRLWSADAIERALAYEEEKSARRAYARGEHWEKRQRMATWWSE